ncbi:hypothetical protein LCGC14_2404820 [marine sediment metagenome]|uniref:Uncharacterized protein n=1 Tax=marine sediment metagenome TaxID=412755 RepID=A0A0F9ENN7_9ZZZZ
MALGNFEVSAQQDVVVDGEDVIDQIALSEIIDYLGIKDILDDIGKVEVMDHFGLIEPE